MKRRTKQYSDEEKAAISAEIAAGQQNISDIAHKHGIHVSTIYQWRHAAKKSGHAIVKAKSFSGRNGNDAGDHEQSEIERRTERHVVYAFAHCQTWIEIYANTLSIPSAFFAERVGELLLQQARGKKLRADNRMPSMW
jgi:transposase-like protein